MFARIGNFSEYTNALDKTSLELEIPFWTNLRTIWTLDLLDKKND